MNGGVNLTGADCAELVQFIDQALALHDAHEFQGMHALGDLLTVQALCVVLNTIRAQLVTGDQWKKQVDESSPS